MDNQLNYCIYRNKKNKNKCNNCIIDKFFCFKHQKYFNNNLLYFINNIFNNDDISIINYKIIDKLYTNTNYYYFSKIIGYLYTYKELLDFSIKNNIIIKKKSKMDIINYIHSILFNTYNRFSNSINKLIKIQNFIKLKINREISNDTDPFSLENITDIDEINRFYFIDNNKKYCFNAIEFYHYLQENNKNPYTNSIINHNIIEDLNKFIIKNNLNIDKNVEWKNSINAYTDVVYYMEKMGFYCNVLWLSKLEYVDIINIIYNYIDFCKNNTNDYYQDFLTNSNNDNYWLLFSKETIRLFKEGNNNFLLCCYLIKSICKISYDFRNNMPDWLENIVEPNLVNNNINNNLTLLFINEYFNLLNNSNIFNNNDILNIDIDIIDNNSNEIINSSNIIINSSNLDRDNSLRSFYYIINNID